MRDDGTNLQCMSFQNQDSCSVMANICLSFSIQGIYALAASGLTAQVSRLCDPDSIQSTQGCFDCVAMAGPLSLGMEANMEQIVTSEWRF